VQQIVHHRFEAARAIEHTVMPSAEVNAHTSRRRCAETRPGRAPSPPRSANSVGQFERRLQRQPHVAIEFAQPPPSSLMRCGVLSVPRLVIQRCGDCRDVACVPVQVPRVPPPSAAAPGRRSGETVARPCRSETQSGRIRRAGSRRRLCLRHQATNRSAGSPVPFSCAAGRPIALSTRERTRRSCAR
jgi:hypothetical protein